MEYITVLYFLLRNELLHFTRCSTKYNEHLKSHLYVVTTSARREYHAQLNWKDFMVQAMLKVPLTIGSPVSDSLPHDQENMQI